MKICLIAEGAYPYVQGGVSSWVNSLMTLLPEYEFVVQTIAATRKDSGQFKYKFPENLTGIQESFLQDNDIVHRKAKPVKLSKQEIEAVRSLLFCEDEQWEVVFDMFKERPLLSLNDLLMGKDFYDLARELYDAKYGRVVFTDFLWTCRSMFLPIFTVLKNSFIEADLYHTVSTGYAGVVAACAGYNYKKPVLLTEHGIYSREREEEIIRASWTRGIYKDLWIEHFYMLSRCCYNRAESIYSLFPRAEEAQHELGCPPDKTEVIPNGVRYDNFQNLVQKDPGDTFVNVGAVLRITPIKDVKTMITSFHYAKQEVPNIKLWLIGPTDEDEGYYKECLELIEMLGAQDIVFLGYVNVLDYLGKMDFIMLTSISEGQPLSLIEAMAASKPCIATRVGDCYDILNAGDEENACGFVESVMNVGKISAAIVKLASSEALRKKMGENGRSRADEKYRHTVFIDRYRDIYRETYERSVL